MEKQKNNIFVFIIMMLLSLTVTSCDDYQKSDSVIHIGYLLLDNHNCVSYERYKENPIGKPVGVIFAEKTDDHPLMAVMLHEVTDVFCDSIGMDNNTSGNITKYDGAENTAAMYKSRNEESGKGCPLANRMMSFHENGQSDYLPSVAEMRLLCKAIPYINTTIMKIGGTPLQVEGDTWYWTSTEVSYNKGMQAWLCSSKNGGILETPKEQRHKARAIVRVNY